MSLYRLEAVVLCHRYLGEADKIVTLYSREKGKVRAVARGARRPRNRLLAGTQPYSYTDFLLFSGKGLDQISQCQLKESFYSLREDLEQMAAAAYVTELYDLMIEEGEGNTGLFHLLLSTLYLLLDGENPDLALRYFELKFLTLLGYQPELTQCVNCGQITDKPEIGFSSNLGGILCEGCWGEDGGAIRLNRGTVEVLKRFQAIPPSKLASLQVNPSMGRELEKVLQTYLEPRLPRQLKSLPFLSLVREGTASKD